MRANTRHRQLASLGAVLASQGKSALEPGAVRSLWPATTTSGEPPPYDPRFSPRDYLGFLLYLTAEIEHGKATGQIVDEDPVVLALEQNSQRGIALDPVTFVREPFSFSNPNYFGTDHRTRIALFSTNFIVTPGLVVTAQAVDAQQVVHQLPVEFVGHIKSFVPVIPQAPVLTQIIVRLPETIGTPGDLQVRIITRGKSSNAVLIGVKP